MLEFSRLKLHFFFIFVVYLLTKDAGEKELSVKWQYYQNREYLINNNLAQYSSYIIVDKNEMNKIAYRIEALIELKYFNQSDKKEDYKCVVKTKDGIIFEMEAYDSVNLYWKNYHRKLYFNLTFESELNELVVAIILKKDFDKALDISSFLDKLDNFDANQKVALPYSLIKFQIPTIIRALHPRSQSVSLCVPYVYGTVPPALYTWIRFHLTYGVGEIMIYDGTETKKLTRYLNKYFKNDERVKVISYPHFKYSKRFYLCDESNLFKQYTDSSCPNKIKTYLKLSCISFVDQIYLNKEFIHLDLHIKNTNPKYKKIRNQIKKIPINDCFIVSSLKHEFIGVYDFDEFVHPRNIEILSETNSLKWDKESICLASAFSNRYKSTDGNYLYNYLINLINIHRNDNDLNKFGSFRFLHAATFTRKDEEKLIEDINEAISKISSQSVLPYKLLANKYQMFLIENEEDVNYMKYLNKTYKTFIQNAYRQPTRYGSLILKHTN